MKSRTGNIIKTIAILSGIAVSILYGSQIPVSKQIGIYDSLKDVATVIFGVMGAWIAINISKFTKKCFFKRFCY